jgi:hypothetical protein
MGATYALTARRSVGAGITIPAPPPEVNEEGQLVAAYHHVQTVASDTWTIPHNLGYRPGGVRVTASNGDTYYPVVVDLDLNTVRLTLADAVTGTAELS